jgi:hypothetical protein
VPLKHVHDEGAYAVQKSVPLKDQPNQPIGKASQATTVPINLEKINRQSINEAGNALGYEPDYLPANNHLCYRVGLAFVLYLGESDSFQDALFYQYHPLDILCTEYPRGLVASYL